MRRFTSQKSSIKPVKLSTLRHIAAVGYQCRNACNGDKADADEREDWFQRELAGNGDAVFRELMLGGSEGLEAVLIYMYGNIDKSTLNISVIKPLMEFDGAKGLGLGSASMQKRIIQGCINVGKIKAISSREAARDEIFGGKALLIVKGVSSYISLEVGGGKARQVSEPENEKTLRGSKEGFIEDIWNNIAIRRKRI